MQDIIQCFCTDILADDTHLERRNVEMFSDVFTEIFLYLLCFRSPSVVQVLNLSHTSVMVSKSFPISCVTVGTSDAKGQDNEHINA